MAADAEELDRRVRLAAFQFLVGVSGQGFDEASAAPVLVVTGTVAGGGDFMAALESVIDPAALR